MYAGSALLLVMLISIVAGLFLFSSKRYASELFPTVDILGYEDLAELTFGAAGRVSELIVEFTATFSPDTNILTTRSVARSLPSELFCLLKNLK